MLNNNWSTHLLHALLYYGHKALTMMHQLLSPSTGIDQLTNVKISLYEKADLVD